MTMENGVDGSVASAVTAGLFHLLCQPHASSSGQQRSTLRSVNRSLTSCVGFLRIEPYLSGRIPQDLFCSRKDRVRFGR